MPVSGIPNANVSLKVHRQPISDGVPDILRACLYRFPMADVLWTFVMACDVFLIVFRRHDARALRKLELRYTLVITLLAFVPAFVFLFIQTEDKGYMYGSVTVSSTIQAPRIRLIILDSSGVPLLLNGSSIA
jgi:hypothetical protein